MTGGRCRDARIVAPDLCALMRFHCAADPIGVPAIAGLPRPRRGFRRLQTRFQLVRQDLHPAPRELASAEGRLIASLPL